MIWLVQSQRQLSAQSLVSLENLQMVPASLDFEVKISPNGRVLINDRKVRGLLRPARDFDEFRWIVLDQPGTFIPEVKAQLFLPQGVSLNEVKAQIYAIHGIGQYSYFFAPPNKIIYTAQNVGPRSELTFVASLPKGSVEFPLMVRIAYQLLFLSGGAWLLLGLLLPSWTLFLLLLIIFKAGLRPQSQPEQKVTKPPSNLPAAVVGALIDGRIGLREIVATLIDLANRDYLLIISKGKKFSFGKRKETEWGKLRAYEQILLSKIFYPKAPLATLAQIQERLARRIFSHKMTEVYLGIYQEATKLGLFLQNPATVQRRYRIAGLVLFTLGLAGFLIGIFLAPDPKFILFFWIGQMISAFLIITISPKLPSRSPKGQAEQILWKRFGQFMKKDKLDYQTLSSDALMKWLPYAVVLEVEVEWATKFLEEPFNLPNWFESNSRIISLEDFTNNLLPLIGYLGSQLAASREPVVS